MSTETRHRVSAEHLRRLATVDKRSLFADATTLIDTEDGITQVPFRVVADALSGHSKLRICRLLYDRSQFAEDGVITGKRPRTTDGGSLDARLDALADGINDDPEDPQPPAHLWPCGCLINDAGAHRVGCPDHPEGVRG